MRLFRRRTEPQPSPLRGEVLGLESLEERAKTLAATLTLARRSNSGRRYVLQRLNDNMKVLRKAYRLLADDARSGELVDPAVEWLLDNFHLLESQTRALRKDLPLRYYKKLPKLAAREFSGMARIYAMALELIRHGDGRIDDERLSRFISAYQSVTPLTLGELWAWPIMLKLALIENSRILTESILQARDARKQANSIVASFENKQAILPLPSRLHSAFVAQLRQRMHEYDPQMSALYSQVERSLQKEGTTAENSVRSEYQRQATDQASIGNTITSLHLCAALNWNKFVERVSLVEQVLRRDPSGDYPKMDFQSRDRYRHAVEQLADFTGEKQVKVSLRAIESARTAYTLHPHDRAAHVGYHLIGRGRGGLEIDVAYHPLPAMRLRRFLFRNATALYLGTIFALTAAASLGAGEYARLNHSSKAAALVLIFAVIPSSELAIWIVQRIMAMWVSPRRLPRLDLESGIPENSRTMVIVPTLLTSLEGVENHIHHLEVQAIGNFDPNIRFALVTDFTDALSAHMPVDEALLEAAKKGIADLNQRRGKDRFYLFHRERRWNPKEGVFMGWERKRGKIEEFNRLLRGNTETGFTTGVGEPSFLPNVRYVLTLDADTRLPRNVARSLIGIISHPLNRPMNDPVTRQVVEGYGILQPRVSVTRSSARGTLFARVYAGHTGVDPYTTAISDTYQDLFAEGAFAGKGLFDVDAFMTAIDGRVPDNAMLSHDLFEGIHARTAFVSDLELVDDYPANVLAHAKRQHRWVRGDWQILSWLFPVVKTQHGFARNSLSAINKWKIFDNLRRIQ